MKPSYNPGQQGFDFGTGNFLEDVCCVFDMNEFPNVEPEDIANKLKCRGSYALDIYRKCMQIWEETVDQEIVNELRQLPNRDTMSVEMMAIALGETSEAVESDIKDAIDALAFGLDQLETDIAA